MLFSPLKSRMDGYENKAQSYSPPYKGLCVAWESAQTGVECCPLACHCAPCQRELHINGDVALFASQYFAMTGNEISFANRSFEFFDQMSQFWLSRAVANSSGGWSILDVLPPDEYADHANDSYYTNVGAAFTLNFTARLAKLLGIHDSRFDVYQEVASQLRLLYSEKLGVHMEYDNYKINQTIKQAGKKPVALFLSVLTFRIDVILASGYPFEASDDPAITRRDLEYYSSVTDKNGPAMTWSLSAVNYLVNKSDEALGQQLMLRSYSQYVREPFFIWYETPTGGTSNFITGAGGFLQGLNCLFPPTFFRRNLLLLYLSFKLVGFEFGFVFGLSCFSFLRSCAVFFPLYLLCVVLKFR